MNAFAKVKRIEQIFSQDVGRGIQSMIQSTTGNLYRAAASLTSTANPRIAICTGFYIPLAKPPAAETDGPPGAAQLAAGFIETGIPVRLITDSFCQTAVQAAMEGTHCLKNPKVELFDQIKNLDVTHFISIERAGPAQDDRVYNMRGIDITDFTPPIHELYESGDWRKIAIGDGGNEIGMGSVSIDKSVPHGEKIACRIPCDDLIVSGVSNWGAWGLMAALAILKPEWKMKFEKYLRVELSKEVLVHCVENGPAVDGVTRLRDSTVDGLDWSYHEDILRQINAVFAISRSKRRTT